MSKINAIKSVKGMPDILPDQSARWRRFENRVADLFALAGFAEIRTPILEIVDLFTHSVGESSDIVRKEMYQLTDLGGRQLVLRPEGTAAVVRSVLQHHLVGQSEESRLWYTGPMFRQENTQKGRQRQFHQIGAEIFGGASALVDAELIALNVKLLQQLGIRGLSVELNTLGDDESRVVYREALVAFLDQNKSQICDDCLERRRVNPLRVLDCKNPECQAIYKNAPMPSDSLSDASRTHFQAVCQGLDDLGVKYQLNAALVRGLDYYTDTVFEIKAQGLGAQSTVSAGGRYDGLVATFGGPPTPAVGFAAGIERILLLMQESETPNDDTLPRPAIAWIALDEQSRRDGLGWLDRLRDAYSDGGADKVIHFPHKGSVKAQMRAANQAGISHVLLQGEQERQDRQVSVKALHNGEQVQVAAEIAAVVAAVKAMSAVSDASDH